MGAATVSAITRALAPGYVASTSTVGGVMLGVCSMGRKGIVMPPASTITIETTEAKIGR
jgi:hypothetical protein